MPPAKQTPATHERPDVGIRCKAAAWQSLRKATGLITDRQLADALGVDPSTVGRTLAGRTEPSMKFAAQTLGMFRFATFEGLFELYDRSPRATR